MSDIQNQNKDHLNIAMIGHKRVPSREGGVEVVVGELSSRLAALGHSVTCYNRRGRCLGEDGGSRKGPDSWNGVKLHYMPTLRQKGLSAFTASFFGSFCCAFGNYDVVHFHAEGPSAMCWLPKLFGKRIIVTVHGLDHQRAKWGWFARKFIYLGEKTAVRWADEIIVLSPSTQRYFLDHYHRRTCFIPNGVSRPQRREASAIKSSLGLEKDSYILFLGRIVPEKGIRYLIEAYRAVRTDKRLVIAGASSDTDRFVSEMRALASGDSRILFTGYVENAVLEELYSNAYIYVLPSDLEGMPLSLLEAMSYGNCCLVSDIAECAGIAEDKALTFRKGETEDLRSQLQQLCDHPEVVASYRAGTADYICSKYDWDDVVEKTLRLYRSGDLT